MADIFRSSDAKDLLQRKFILILGGSNFRALYRDLIWLFYNNSMIPENHLRRKLDFSYLGDRLLKQGKLSRGRDYLEMREYSNNDFQLKFNFLTKCITQEVETLMKEYKEKKTKCPDVVLFNSCIWDITRWGPNGVNLYKENMQKLLNLFKSSLPSSTLVIFSTTLPISSSCTGAFLVKQDLFTDCVEDVRQNLKIDSLQVEFMKHSLRFEIMEANLFVRQLVPTYGYNILDFHYHFRMQIHRRIKDGVHWVPEAIRYMTNLLLTHIALSWDKSLPGNFDGKLLSRMKESAKFTKENTQKVKLPDVKIIHSPVMPPPRTPVTKSQKSEKRKKNINVINKPLIPCENVSQPLINYSTNFDPNYSGIGITRLIRNHNLSQPAITYFNHHLPYQVNNNFSRPAVTYPYADPLISHQLNNNFSQRTLNYFDPNAYLEPAFFYEDPSFDVRASHGQNQRFKINNRHVSRATPY